MIDIGENGEASSIFLGGHYEDVYAKTADGWRFKTRTFIASATGNPPEQPAPRGAAPAPNR